MKNNSRENFLDKDKIFFQRVNEILKDYPNIKNAMKKDEYRVYNEICTDFKEIWHEDEIIGFITYFNTMEQEVSINNYYVEKKYRNKDYLADEIKNLSYEGYVVTLINPDRREVEELLENNIAEKVSDRIVVSGVNFVMTPDNLKGTKYTKNAYIPEGTLVSTTSYDLDTCSVVYLDDISSHKFAKSIFFSNINPNDLKEYDPTNNRKDLENTIDHIKKLFTDNSEQIEETVIHLREKLGSKEYTIEEIQTSIQEDISNNIITEEKAKKIEDQLIQELKDGKITNESIYLRLKFLEKYEEKHPNEIVDKNRKCICKSCSQYISISQSYCYNCGHVINKEEYHKLLDFESNDLIEEIKNAKYSLHDDFDFKSPEYRDELKYLKLIEALGYLYSDSPLDSVIEYLQEDIPNVDIEKELLNEKYISNKYDEKEIEKELKAYSKDDLKVMAEYFELKKSGKEPTLIKRLKKYFKNELKERGFYITPFGIETLISNQDFLKSRSLYDKYVYSELEEVADEVGSTRIMDVLEVFYNKHLEHAWKLKNFDYYTYTLDKLSELYNALNRYDEAVSIEIKSFLIHLNPYMMNPKLIEVYNLENAILNTIKRLHFFIKIEDMKTEDKLNKYWKELEIDKNTIFVPLKDCKKILKESVELVYEEEILEYFMDVTEKYFRKYY